MFSVYVEATPHWLTLVLHTFTNKISSGASQGYPFFEVRLNNMGAHFS
jgi:hypothetical protein